MVDSSCIVEGNVKFRDGRKWKSRWCVMRKLSPVADCLHLQLYADSKDRYKQGQTKASLSLQHFLGVQSGFTLDKESNTIAIICQDVTVVLAFDTRERLIQWQVKISNNLGDDLQFLVLVSSAPSRSKLTNGPAHLHVQERRFCMTVGVPPRLAGVWEIVQLRRYGVVEGRFCFEGGSRCGRGEGLHVLVTDQSEEISRALQLAAEGKLQANSGRRRLGAGSEGHRGGAGDSRPECFPSAVSCAGMVSGTDERNCTCWSSAESRGLAESTSVLERCSSCSGKLPLLSRRHFADRISLSSYSGGSSRDSDYSSSPVPPPVAPSPLTLPPRPPKPSPTIPKVTTPDPKKPPMPLPSYENYDVPRSFSLPPQKQRLPQLVIDSQQQLNYDTPRKIQEYLTSPKAVTPVQAYPNYDTPPLNSTPVLIQQCGCPAKIHHHHHNHLHQQQPQQQQQHRPSPLAVACSCHGVMSWAGFVVPYCRDPPVSINPVKLSGEGKMPVVDASNGFFKNSPNANNSANSTNYENFAPTIIDSQPAGSYANMDFTESLGNYENSKDFLAKFKDEAKEVQVEVQETSVEKESEYLAMDGHNKMLVKSSSNPSLNQEIKKAMQSGSSATSSPYFRRRLFEVSGGQELLLRKRSYSAESARYLDEVNYVPGSFQITATIHQPISPEPPELESPTIVEDCPSIKAVQSIKIRRSSSVPGNAKTSAGNNRDSSSSNDSGVSTGSLTAQNQFQDCSEFPAPTPANTLTKKNGGLGLSNGCSYSNNNFKRVVANSTLSGCYHASLPRKSRSNDPLKELSFQFHHHGHRAKVPQKSSSVEADILPVKTNGNERGSPTDAGGNAPYIDSRSTSSGTSDMSDYIETLSLSSHSSSDAPDTSRAGGKAVATTLRPRSGKEYCKIDRSILVQEHQNQQLQQQQADAHQQASSNYANVAPNPRKIDQHHPVT